MSFIVINEEQAQPRILGERVGGLYSSLPTAIAACRQLDAQNTKRGLSRVSMVIAEITQDARLRGNSVPYDTASRLYNSDGSPR